MNVEKKKIWITGASSGIGKALALELASRGAQLILSARDKGKLEAVKRLTGLPDDKVFVLPFDLSSEDSLHKANDQVKSRFGGVDVLIHNAGVSQRSYFLNTHPDVFRKILDVNFFGAVHLTRLVLPGMINQKSGKLVVVSSIVGKFGYFLRTGYSASKHALHGMFDSLRFEYEQEGVSVLLVCPGRVDTNISKHALNGDGVLYGQHETGLKNGISAEKCAKKIVKAIIQDKHEIYPGGKEIFMVYIKRFLPGLLTMIIRKMKT